MFSVTVSRQCSRPGCTKPAVATLEYNYAQQIAILEPLQILPDPHRWDLCEEHTQRTTVPQGWTLHAADMSTGPFHGEEDTDEEDLMALVEAVQQAAHHVEETSAAPAPRVIRREEIPQPSGHHPARQNLPATAPRRHLRAVRGSDNRPETGLEN